MISIVCLGLLTFGLLSSLQPSPVSCPGSRVVGGHMKRK